MDYRVLGRTGVRVSPICLGSDNFGDATPEDEATKILNRAFDAGINLVDTGDVYAEGMSETIIGKTVRERGNRHDVLLATKVDHGRRPARRFTERLRSRNEGPTGRDTHGSTS